MEKVRFLTSWTTRLTLSTSITCSVWLKSSQEIEPVDIRKEQYCTLVRNISGCICPLYVSGASSYGTSRIYSGKCKRSLFICQIQIYVTEILLAHIAQGSSCRNKLLYDLQVEGLRKELTLSLPRSPQRHGSIFAIMGSKKAERGWTWCKISWIHTDNVENHWPEK